MIVQILGKQLLLIEEGFDSDALSNNSYFTPHFPFENIPIKVMCVHEKHCQLISREAFHVEL